MSSITAGGNTNDSPSRYGSRPARMAFLSWLRQSCDYSVRACLLKDHLLFGGFKIVVVPELFAGTIFVKWSNAFVGHQVRTASACGSAMPCRGRSFLQGPHQRPGSLMSPPTKMVPSYMESPRFLPALPHTTMRPRCIMKPDNAPVSPPTRMVPPFWSMPVREPTDAHADQIAATNGRAEGRTGVLFDTTRARHHVLGT